MESQASGKVSLDLKEIKDIVEKPKIKKAPSNMAAVGRYILEPEVFEFIEENKKTNKEIELTDAIRAYINSGEKV